MTPLPPGDRSPGMSDMQLSADTFRPNSESISGSKAVQPRHQTVSNAVTARAERMWKAGRGCMR